LALECLVEHLFGENLSDRENGVLDGSQSGAPGRTIGTVDPIDQIDGDLFDLGTDSIGGGGRNGGGRHPWHRLAVGGLVVSWCQRDYSQVAAPCKPNAAK